MLEKITETVINIEPTTSKLVGISWRIRTPINWTKTSWEARTIEPRFNLKLANPVKSKTWIKTSPMAKININNIELKTH